MLQLLTSSSQIPMVEYLYSHLPPVKFAGKKLVGRVVFSLMIIAAALVGALTGLFIVYSTDLPQVSELERYRPSATTELYDDKGKIIGTFALQRRIIVQYDDLPKVLRDALISIEDKDFDKHWGVNFWRVLGAAYHDFRAHRGKEGASTLTMQLSRNLFLSQDRTLGRKFQEIMLSLQIERRFTKQQILTMYCNQIYLGHGVYGFEAASQFYFNKRARDLTLSEAAVLAGLPKSPGGYSPITNPEKAVQRRNLVINSMLEDGKITAAEATKAKAEPVNVVLQSSPNQLAPWFTEEIRRYLEKKYGSDEVHQGGLRVYTTLNTGLQRTANQVVLDGLVAYEHRHGWKGKLKNVKDFAQTIQTYEHPDWEDQPEIGGYIHGVITATSPVAATVKIGHAEAIITEADMKWTGQRSPAKILSPGDIVYVKVISIADDGSAKVALEQDSGAQGSLLAIDNATGDIKAMVGGRDYEESKFNRATQALRQTGSSFKPYVYTAAVEDGVLPDDIILDAPTTFISGGQPYSPHNYDGKFEGNITIRHALAESRNIPALKLAERASMRSVIDTARKFGITSPMPPYLPVALGSAEVTLFEQVAAYSTFPNDGVRVSPRYIRKVVDYDGHVLEENYPEVKDVISSATARTMTSLLREVVLHGTAFTASALKHPLAGKTGTTNDFTDAWFIGFSPSVTCGVWVGFDEKKTLGKKEAGALAALPIWINYMKAALVGLDNEDFFPPPPPPSNAVAIKEDTPTVKPGEETE
jgi:penicillin-binding protein 1A